MHKIHVTEYYQHDLADVFSAITDHKKFLSGGGLTCRIVTPSQDKKNGLGTVRSIHTKKYTLTEEIISFVENESYDYIIQKVNPKINFKHHNGWLQFTQEAHKKVRVDWHSHFTFTTPIIGHLIGWVVKKQLEKVFLQRLSYMKKHMG